MSFIPATPDEKKEMLHRCGFSSTDELFNDIPAELRPAKFSLPDGKSEFEVFDHCHKLSGQNSTHLINFLGCGFYDHFIPAAVDALSGRSEFYTAYTPYQPELSQGTLQSIYEYQSHICRLTGLDYSNASLYDGGTALYEACQMATNATGRNKIVIDGGVNPLYRKMLRCHTANLKTTLIETDSLGATCCREILLQQLDNECAAVVLQNPNFFGAVDNHSDIAEKCRQKGIITIQSVYPVAMALLKSPGEQGVDIATGEGQSLGIPLSSGGPYLGFISVRKELVRRMPGRIVARTVDDRGREGFVLSLQAREQHIRREKATSNICTNEALCALRANIYLALLGKSGMKNLAHLCMKKAHWARERICSIPQVSAVGSYPIFNEFLIEVPVDAAECCEKMAQRGFAAGFPVGKFYKNMERFLLIAVTEKRTKNEIEQFAQALEDLLCL